MGRNKVNILLVDDDPGDCRLVRKALGQSPQMGQFAIETAGNLAEGLDFLKSHSFDLVLLDLGLPDSRGLETLDKVREACQQTAIVVLTDFADEQTGIEAIRKGASDYLVKTKFHEDLLARTIRYSLERKQAEVLREAYAQTGQLLTSISSIMIGIDEREQVIQWNEAAQETFGFSDADALLALLGM
ncbi:response regulator [Planctomycetota bacterium]